MKNGLHAIDSDLHVIGMGNAELCQTIVYGYADSGKKLFLTYAES